MNRKITIPLVALLLGIAIVLGGLAIFLALQSTPISDSVRQAQIAQMRINALDAHVTPRMRAQFINQLMKGISTGDLKTLGDCVYWEGVEESIHEKVLASLKELIDGSQDFPMQLSIVPRVDTGQLTYPLHGRTHTQNLPWVTNVALTMPGRLAPKIGGTTFCVGEKEGRLYIVCMVPTKEA
jgi:hypothetical protein